MSVLLTLDGSLRLRLVRLLEALVLVWPVDYADWRESSRTSLLRKGTHSYISLLIFLQSTGFEDWLQLWASNLLQIGCCIW